MCGSTCFNKLVELPNVHQDSLGLSSRQDKPVSLACDVPQGGQLRENDRSRMERILPHQLSCHLMDALGIWMSQACLPCKDPFSELGPWHRTEVLEFAGL